MITGLLFCKSRKEKGVVDVLCWEFNI